MDWLTVSFLCAVLSSEFMKTQSTSTNSTSEINLSNALPEVGPWTKVIFDGLTHVPNIKDFGNIIAYGQNTVPLLKYDNKSVTIMAGADVGKGKVLAVSHKDYAKYFIEKPSRKKRGTSGLKEIEDCRSSVVGDKYIGKINKTVTGRTCQAWNKQFPHKHTRDSIKKFPDKTFQELGNNCRNPDGESKPWCYTSDPDKRWERCDVPICKSAIRECKLSGKAWEYVGTLATTKNGYECMKWTSQNPHKHTFTDIEKFPDGSFKEAKNYCRNPDMDEEAWCYTTDPKKRWDFCDVPLCDDSPLIVLHRLGNNIKNFLSQGQFEKPESICHLKDSTSMACLENPEIKIVYYIDQMDDWATKQDGERLLNWIKAGGSLFYALTGWEWQDKSKIGKSGQPFTEIPFATVMKSAGIAFTDTYYSSKKPLKIARTNEELEALKALNINILSKRILTLPDFEKYEPNIDIWIDMVDGFISQDIYESLLQKLCVTMRPVGNALENKVPWPQGSVKEELGVEVTETDQKVLKFFYYLGSIGCWKRKAPNADRFPGDVVNPPPVESYVFEKTTKVENYWSTGMYLLPGQEMTIELINGDMGHIEVLIGSHTDELYHKKTLYRFPCIKRWVKLHARQFSVSHWHGGLISVYTYKQSEQKAIKLKLDGLIKAPYFDLDDPTTITEWKTRKNAPAPWADIRGKHMRYTIPSYAARALENPKRVMEMWDNVVTSNYDLDGTPMDQRPFQWASCDIQISVGSLHSGYPIGYHLDKSIPTSKSFLLDENNWDYHWGMYHEFGHNIQSKYWTFTGTVEVTTNIFSLFQKQRLTGKDPFITQMKTDYNGDAFKRYLTTQYYNKGWAEPWTPLMPYAQLAHYFGWNCFHKVFKSYYTGIGLPTNDQEERDQWVERFSKAVGYNLCPLYEFYSYPLTDKMCQNLDYPPFFPDDVVSQFSEAQPLVKKLKAKYPSLVRSVTTLPDCPDYPKTY